MQLPLVQMTCRDLDAWRQEPNDRPARRIHPGCNDQVPTPGVWWRRWCEADMLVLSQVLRIKNHLSKFYHALIFRPQCKAVNDKTVPNLMAMHLESQLISIYFFLNIFGLHLRPVGLGKFGVPLNSTSYLFTAFATNNNRKTASM